jgi:hypothetical protein
MNIFDQVNEIETHEPTLQSSCMLVEQSISVWEGVKLDRKASAQVTRANNAEQGTASVRKKLLGDCEELTAVKQLRNLARSFHRDNTMPWSNSGLRLLSTEQYFDYNPQISGLRNEFYKLVDAFIDAYAYERQIAHVKLGNLFDPSEYPSDEELRRKFKFEIVYMPLPESGDFRVDMQEQTKSALRQDYTSYFNKQVKAAMDDVWERLLTPLQNMSARLDYRDGEKPTGFRDTLVSNVEDIAKLLKTCNITNDPDMERVRQELVSTLKGVTSDGLREDGHLRRKTKSEIDNIIKNLPSLTGQ